MLYFVACFAGNFNLQDSYNMPSTHLAKMYYGQVPTGKVTLEAPVVHMQGLSGSQLQIGDITAKIILSLDILHVVIFHSCMNFILCKRTLQASILHYFQKYKPLGL